MMSCEKIVIAGFSGAGKSTLLKELSKSAPDEGWEFDDLDTLVIRSRRGQEISKIVEEHGWEKFRLWERQALEGWLKEEGKGVLSLGGGSMSQMIYDLFSPSRKIKFCYLHSDFEVCWNRLIHDSLGEERPLVKLGKGELHRIYQDRQKIFNQIPFRLENPEGKLLDKLAEEFWENAL